MSAAALTKPMEVSEIREALPADFDTICLIDDDATGLYAGHGMPIELAPDHPFARAEQGRWRRSLELRRGFIAIDAAGEALGFATLDWLDGHPYLDQLAVRRSAMRRGIGGRLIARASEWAQAAGGAQLWLTTYAHLPFNRPYYERHGFITVPEPECAPDIVHCLAEQRDYLPAPEQRIAMRKYLK
jgi:GNAT superfamily N-acetyltransferase